MQTTTQGAADCYSFLRNSASEANQFTQMAVEDLAKAMDGSAVGFFDSNVIARAMLTAYLDTTPPEEIETEFLSRAAQLHMGIAERVLMHPRIRITEGIGRELQAVCDKAEEVIARDIAAYSVSYASLEARRLVPHLRDYRSSLDSLSVGLTQILQAEHVPVQRALFSSLLKLVQLASGENGSTEEMLTTQHLAAAALYDLMDRVAQEPERAIQVVVLSNDRACVALLSACVRFLCDTEFLGRDHRLASLFGHPKGGRMLVIGFQEKAQRFGSLYDSAHPYTETLEQTLQRTIGSDNREINTKALREMIEEIIKHEEAYRESVINRIGVSVLPDKLIVPLLAPEPPSFMQDLSSIEQEESRTPMETIENQTSTSVTASNEPIFTTPAASIIIDAPTLDNLPPTDELMAQTLRKLYRENYTSLSQVTADIERLGNKLLTDEGTRRLAERCGDEALAHALKDEVSAARQVIDGKLALLQTQKAELLQKKAALNAEIENLRASVVIVANAVDREMELLRRDAELGRLLSDVLSKLRAFSPLADSLNRIGSGMGFSAVPNASGTFRLAQIVEELGDAPHNVSALIKQLREKGILPEGHQRGIYSAQDRQIIVDMHRSKSVSEISREWGNAVITLKLAIEQRLIEGRDYYNLGKGSQRDSYRVTPLGMDKLKKALSLTRAGQRG